LFGAGILADLAGVIMIAFSLQDTDLPAIYLHISIFIIIVGILTLTVGYFIYSKLKIKEEQTAKTVDAVIEDSQGNIILIKRKYPPFKDYFALPGGFIEKGENPKQALIREVKEETNLNVKILKKIGVFDEEGRDPRGRIVSTAFLCQIIGDTSTMESGTDSAEVELIPIDDIKSLDLAFDHREILKESRIIH
jgi:8-oxo-dGTP diphosphatase